MKHAVLTAILAALAFAGCSGFGFTASNTFRFVFRQQHTQGQQVVDLVSGYKLSKPSKSSFRSRLQATTSPNPLLDVFNQIDIDGGGTICVDELQELLNTLGMVATNEEVAALFKTLDVDGSGSICFDEFTTWYEDTLETCLLDPSSSTTSVILENLKTRRTVNNFSEDLVDPEIVKGALEAAIMAPNHRRTEPWRFISLGPNSIKKVASLNPPKESRWSSIPGWMVVTSPKSSDPLIEKEDYAAVSCAVQNFQLALWANGVGTKWTTGDVTRSEEFNDICGIDGSKESVVGCVWYGWTEGEVKDVKRKKAVDDILTVLD